jgi:CDP-paratose 2-epimerase
MKKIALVTGSAGLIGSESCRRFHAEGFGIAGLDNDMRAQFFGPAASTTNQREALQRSLSDYRHHAVDIRDAARVLAVFQEYGSAIKAVIHTAAQPSHDWAARDPLADFSVNATGTLHVLEAARQTCPEAPFIFTSTNKVYGDSPNQLPFVEQPTRWELPESHPSFSGLDEHLSIDHTTHSVFGASKVAADVMVQEYGRYFGMPTVSIRGGCLTGPAHAGTELHGFLSYLMKCTVGGTRYRIIGHQGKQVRDNIHAHDLVEAFWQFCQSPRSGAVYNLGGSRHAHCSLLEAISLCEAIADKRLAHDYIDTPRHGDHRWYISDVRRFQADYPRWQYRYSLRETLEEMHAACLRPTRDR